MVEYHQEVLKEKVDLMTITYNKLVRDLIPEIIQSSGKTCSTEILSNEEYLKFVDAKIDEELAEYHKDQNIEELADLLEVIAILFTPTFHTSAAECASRFGVSHIKMLIPL